MAKTGKTRIERTSRTDAIIALEQRHTGKIDTPKKYNHAFAAVLRLMADAIDQVDDAWADPEIVV